MNTVYSCIQDRQKTIQTTQIIENRMSKPYVVFNDSFIIKKEIP